MRNRNDLELQLREHPVQIKCDAARQEISEWCRSSKTFPNSFLYPLLVLWSVFLVTISQLSASYNSRVGFLQYL